MKTSQFGIDFIKSFESFSPTIYQCSAGKNTVGWGHVIKKTDCIIPPITEAQADEILAKDLERFEAAVLKAVDVELEQHELDALVSLAFNIGDGAFAGSTLVRKLNAYDPTSATEFLRWDKCNGKPLAGLTRRRSAERMMFLGAA